MKNFKRIYILALALLAVAGTASAQFRFGLKAGINVNTLHFSEETFSSANRTGFTGGVMGEFGIPLTGIKFDLGLMYVHRVSEFEDAAQKPETQKSDYLQVPLNFKIKIGVPVISPYLFTGPSIAFRLSKEDVQQVWKSKSFDASWNVGAGVELMNHLQLSASYGFGITKAMEHLGVNSVDLGRNNCWTVTAAYLF